MQDMEYLKSLYPREVRILQGYVSEACDRMDYRNSPMYDEYPDQLMIDRICGTICETVEAAEWGEGEKKIWDRSGEDREKLASSIDLDIQGNVVSESQNGTENQRQKDYGSTYGEAEEPEYTSGKEYRESLVNPAGIEIEIQEMMAREKGEDSNLPQWPSAEMLLQNEADSELQQRPGSVSRLSDTADFSVMEKRGSIYSAVPPRPPYPPQPGPGPIRPPRPPYPPQPGPEPVRPPRPPYPPQPGPEPVRPPRPPRPPQPGPGPVRPPRPPYPPQPGPGPIRPPRPPYPPQPGPGPVHPPRPPYPPQPGPEPVRPPRPIFPSGSDPSWLRDLIQVLLLNEMYQRRCAAGRC